MGCYNKMFLNPSYDEHLHKIFSKYNNKQVIYTYQVSLTPGLGKMFADCGVIICMFSVYHAKVDFVRFYLYKTLLTMLMKQ